MEQAIKSSSSMHKFCEDVAFKMLTFANSLPVDKDFSEGFFEVIQQEVDKIQTAPKGI